MIYRFSGSSQTGSSENPHSFVPIWIPQRVGLAAVPWVSLLKPATLGSLLIIFVHQRPWAFTQRTRVAAENMCYLCHAMDLGIWWTPTCLVERDVLVGMAFSIRRDFVFKLRREQFLWYGFIVTLRTVLLNQGGKAYG